MHRTKVKFESKQRAIIKKKKKKKKSYGSCALHSPMMRSIHPQNFITIVSTVLDIYSPTKFHNHSNYSFGDMHRTKVKFESKQRAIIKKEKKKKKKKKSYGSCALHSPMMRSIHPQNFITIVSTVLDIWSGQNSSMKINKGQ